MCAAGSCENAPPRRLPSENAPVIIARAIGELSLSVPAAATWSQVARMSRTSSSTASRSTSVIALVRTTFCFCRLRAWRASSVPPTTTSVPPPWNTTSSSPWSRNTDCVAFGRSFIGSLPRGARSTAATSASSASRSRVRPASGARVASCSGVARGSAAGST